jgi:poly-gamma-glutamate system protein
MYQFNAKSKRVLSVLTILALVVFLIVENTKVDIKRKWYDQKLEASKLANKAANFLKDIRLQNGIFIDAINDPNETALIGQDITQITTDRGYIDSKLTSINPNFAAVIVEMLKEAGVNNNDVVAVSFTGSLPGLNIAVLAAVQTLKLKPVIITSVGASNWGANDPYFTWLDMEKKLFDAGIFKYKSIAASIGGGLDNGRGLSPEGRKLIKDAINRTDAIFINEDFLENSIKKRIDTYNRYKKNKPIKVYINVGGGIASLGSTENNQFIPTGLIESLPLKNFPSNGVLIEMAKKKIPVIHLLNVTELATKYGLPISPKPLPNPGSGEVFVKKQYNIVLTILVTLVLVISIIYVFILEQKHHKLGAKQVAVFKQVKVEDNLGL